MTTFKTPYLTEGGRKKLQSIGATITRQPANFQIDIPGAYCVASLVVMGPNGDEWLDDDQYVLGYFDRNAGIGPVFCLPEENPTEHELFKKYFWERENWNQWQIWRRDYCLPLP